MSRSGSFFWDAPGSATHHNRQLRLSLGVQPFVKMKRNDLTTHEMPQSIAWYITCVNRRQRVKSIGTCCASKRANSTSFGSTHR